MKRLLLCVLTCFPLTLEAQRTSLSNYLLIDLPPTFSPLSKEEIHTQYIQRNAPIAVYRHQTDYETTWSFTLNENSWPITDTTIIRSFWKVKVQEMYRGQSVRFVKAPSSSVSLPPVALAFIVSRGAHSSRQRYYHYIQHMIVESQELIIHFICPIHFYQAHRELIEYVVRSISEKK